MSIAAMNWAWQLQLRPNVKFVLLALADAADDEGFCWPSIPKLSRKSCMDERSVQRIIAKLKADNLISVERRFRPDGSPTSNKYRLALHKSGGGKLSPPTASTPPAAHHQPDDSTPPDGGSVVVLTTNEPSMESPPQPLAHVCCGDEAELIFPKQLLPPEIDQASLLIAAFDRKPAQAILDELAGRLNAQTVRGSPLGYLRSLCSRAKQGTFTPELGIRVALARQKDAERAALLATPQNSGARTKDPVNEIAKLRNILNQPKK